jgi:DNA-binding transcriptional ArsR family regulator
MLAAELAATDELCVCDLARISGRADNLVSHHARALRTAGLADLLSTSPATRLTLDGLAPTAGDRPPGC